MEQITLTITVWDADKVDALIRKIESDSRVLKVERIDQ